MAWNEIVSRRSSKIQIQSACTSGTETVDVGILSEEKEDEEKEKRENENNEFFIFLGRRDVLFMPFICCELLFLLFMRWCSVPFPPPQKKKRKMGQGEGGGPTQGPAGQNNPHHPSGQKPTQYHTQRDGTI